MKVILIKTVNKLGLAGELKEVADGYARNFLIPNKFALVATPQVIDEWQSKAKASKKVQVKEASDAKKLAKILSSVIIEIKTKANKEGTLFGAITPKQLIEGLKQRGVELDKKYLDYTEPIKIVGEYEVGYKLADGNTGKFRIKVIKE